MRWSPALSVTLVSGAFLGLGVAFSACASSTTDDTTDAAPSPTATLTGTTGPDGASPPKDASADAASPDATSADASDPDAACGDAGVTTFGPGDTCAPFGEGTPCGGGCVPKYGYVCTGGGPPNLTGCRQMSNSTFGGTYCCPELSCVRSTFQDKDCAGKPGKTQMRVCPVDAQKNLRAPPPAGCEVVTGPEYRYFCCPP
ncbi:MAG: hypothetical protein JNM74_28020 [Myxococcales bacterium]|nr:hypothetical protein [Myxococcales bacterium]